MTDSVILVIPSEDAYIPNHLSICFILQLEKHERPWTPTCWQEMPAKEGSIGKEVDDAQDDTEEEFDKHVQ